MAGILVFNLAEKRKMIHPKNRISKRLNAQEAWEITVLLFLPKRLNESWLADKVENATGKYVNLTGKIEK